MKNFFEKNDFALEYTLLACLLRLSPLFLMNFGLAFDGLNFGDFMLKNLFRNRCFEKWLWHC